MQGREEQHFGGDGLRPTRAARAADSLSLVGSVVDGRYLVERLVGSGGFGLVYRAIHLRFNSSIALKVLRVPPRCSNEQLERVAARFAEEGRLAFNLGALHPGIVRVFEAGTLSTPGGVTAPYLAMEWLEGAPLAELVAERRARSEPPQSLLDVLELLELAAQGLAAAHRARVAHCDVKPANLFVCFHDGQRVAKLLDFGLAEVVIDSAAASSSVDSVSSRRAFTSAYAAPEQWLPRLGRTGLWTDVHGLALVCTELLCGRRAFEDDDSRQLMAACLDESVRPTPGRRGALVSNAVEHVFEKALAVAPRARFRDVPEFWQALRSASVSSSCRVVVPLASDTVQAAPAPTEGERLASATGPTRSARQEALRPVGPEQNLRGSSRPARRLLVAGARLVLLGALGSGGWALLDWSRVSAQSRAPGPAPLARAHGSSAQRLPAPGPELQPARHAAPGPLAPAPQRREPDPARPSRPRASASAPSLAAPPVVDVDATPGPPALSGPEAPSPSTSPSLPSHARLNQLLQRPALITRQ